MKKLLFLLLAFPAVAWGQSDSLRPIRPQDLKPIGSDLIPTYGRYGRSVRTRYTYDGIDVRRARDLEKYIRASGDIDANAEFDRYLGQREAGRVVMAGGFVAAVVGCIIMGSNRPGSDGKFTTTQQLPSPSPGVYYIGGNTITVPDKARENAYSGGFLVTVGGAILAGIGWGMQRPGNHLRRSVQYYNRALKQQQLGISWKLQPYSRGSNAGVGLVGRF